MHAATLPREYDPKAHGVQLLAPAALYWPALHAPQLVAPEAEAKVPGAQLLHAPAVAALY